MAPISSTIQTLEDIQHFAERLRENVSQVIVGKHDVIDLFLVALIAGGHILLEDVPGTGKTLLAKALARSLACDFKRIQFTPDLLPGDLTGVQVWNPSNSQFSFRAGPVFTNLLLADEINRATPRTQSSLLEAMEENQVTVDGETRILEQPFFVVATQNPVENQGTFPLPEAQLDRFLMKVNMGYPTTQEGLQILRRFRGADPLSTVEPVASTVDILAAHRLYPQVIIQNDVLGFLLAIAEKTRQHESIMLGVSPRGTQAMLRCAQVHAILHGRTFVTPDDILQLLVPVFGHRILLRNAFRVSHNTLTDLLQSIARDIPVPTENVLSPLN